MIYPMFALVLLTCIVAGHLLHLRIKAVKAGQVRLSQFRLNQSTEIPDNIVQAARNYTNLFEVPVLFYVAGCLSIVLNTQGIALQILAWLFVISRIIHSWIHLTNNNVIHRFRAFIAGNVCVLAIWVLLLIDQIQRSQMTNFS